MKKTYLLLTIIGFVLPSVFVTKVSIETGNYLLYTRPLETMQAMFANDIATAFILDLLFLVVLFLIWSYQQTKKHQLKHLWVVWLFTFAFGLASGLPLFLYLKERQLSVT